jgi:hypothetical protein
MLVALGKPEKQTLDLDAPAIDQKALKPFWAQRSQAFDQHIDVMKTSLQLPQCAAL